MKKHQKILITLISSILLTIAWPVWGYPIFIFFGFVPLLWLENRIAEGEKGRVLWLAFFAFFVWNVATTWWVWNATPAAIAAWLLNALFMGIIFWMFHLTKKKLCNNVWGNFFIIPYWMAFELLTYHWVAKWPWLNLGNAFSTCHQWVQWYEYTGLSGGTLWVLLSNILITNAIISHHKQQKKCAMRFRLAA